MEDRTPGAKSAIERLLGIFAEVRSGEGITVLLLMTNVFLLLTCYYILKPLREALILAIAATDLPRLLKRNLSPWCNFRIFPPGVSGSQ